MTKFFCNHNCKDMKRSKCNFCLAFCSVFIVVLSTLIINTIIGFGPIIFLRLGEQKVGQYDAIFLPLGTEYSDYNTYDNSNTTNTTFLNFTSVSLHNNATQNPTFNLAPRK